jgi:hypothetical protein
MDALSVVAVPMFRVFVAAHIAVGLVGLITFWVPIAGRKGGPQHRRFGRVFTWSMLAAGAAAVGISCCTLVAPLQTHATFPPPYTEAPLVRGIFGWMMVYLATLTINLAWYGWQCVRNRNQHLGNREWRNLFLQAAVFVLALNCVGQGLMLGQPLMIGASMVGFATVGTNLYFIYGAGQRNAWLREHIKALIGAGISVYTAFLALGAVRLFPSLALSPELWALPLTTGIGLILFHWRNLEKHARPVPTESTVS